MIKHTLWIGLLALGAPAAWAFSLLGPVGNGGDAWQVTPIGYNPLGLSSAPPYFIDPLATGPKNLGEGYRRNTPVLYYAYDATFLGNGRDAYFGSNGVVAVDSAFAILNNLFTNTPAVAAHGIDAYSPGLSEFPLNAGSVNYQAQGLGLLDLKSETLSLMLEQLGLADAVRYTWTLHNRYTPPGATCPTQDYTVVQRNYDVTTTPLNQIEYSPYVNGVLYSYIIEENCGAPGASPPDADAYEVPTDPLFNNPPVASGNGEDSMYLGEFYTGLTRDDVAGLRDLLSTNDLETESATAGSLLLATNAEPPQLVSTLPLGPFILQSQTLGPAALQALYPNLIIVSTVTNYSFNITAAGYSFTNQPGAFGTATNYSPPQELNLPPNPIPPPPGFTGWPGTMDFGLLSQQALTNTTGQVANDPLAIAQLEALYPNLVIVSATPYFTNVTTTNYVTYLTNMPGSALGNPPVQVTVPSGTFTTFEARYHYVFANVLLNSNGTFYPFTDTLPPSLPFTNLVSLYGTNQAVTIQTISVTNVVGSALGNAAVTNISTSVRHQYGITGDFFVEPTNWCGYTILTNYTPIKTVLVSHTNAIVAAGTTNAAGGVAQFTQNTIFTYTNWQFIIEPGVCEPGLYYLTNTTVAFVTNYQETFANVVTNTYFPDSLVTLVTTNISPCPGGQAGTLCTNVSSVTFETNTPSGDFWIEPPTWNCGYNIQLVVSTNSVTTNSILYSATIPAGVPNIGEQYSVTEIFNYTNHDLLIQPIICQTEAPPTNSLYQGIGKMRFVRVDYDSLLSQLWNPITNDYSMVAVATNGLVTQHFQRVVTTPDFLFGAADLSSGPQSLLNNPAFSRNINFNQNNIYPNLAGPGTIDPPTTILFNKVGPVYVNLGPQYLTGPNNPQNASQYALYFLWGSFDGSTNDPIVYPNGTSIANLADEVLIQISPASLPNGAVGVDYPAVTLSVTGGQAPYSWSLASGSALPPGLDLSSGGVISGIPTQSGAFVTTIQMTDAGGRTVNVNYSITIN